MRLATLIALVLLGLVTDADAQQRHMDTPNPLASRGSATGVWENASFGPEGTAVGGSLISAIVAAPDGSVFASGTFQVAGGTAADQVARWDGEAWHALGSGLDFYAADLAAGPGGALYVVGPFHRAGGVAVRAFAAWNGAAWSTLGDGPATGTLDAADAVAVGPDGTVYVAVNTSVPFSDFTYPVGRVVKWDGTAWVPVGAPFEAGPGTPSAAYDLVAAADGSLYVSGDFGVRRWTGALWEPVGGGLEGRAVALVPDGSGGLYAGGAFVLPGQTTVTYVARWNGSVWTTVGTFESEFQKVRALAVGPSGTVYAGGRFTTFGGAVVNHIARWDGTAWRPMAGGLEDATVGGGFTQVNGLAVTPDGTLHVGGVFDRAGGLLTPTLARWRDGAWVPGGGGINEAVRAITTDAAGRTVIGGQFLTAGGHPVNHVAVRTADGWDRIGAGLFDIVQALERDRDGDLIACSYGTFRWDGVAWTNTGLGPVGSRCTDLTVDLDRNVYAAGYWADGVPTTVQRWDGAAWTSLGNPGQFTSAVAVDSSGTLYAGGRYGVSRYDAGSWVTIGAVMDGDVYALTVGTDGALYAGGRFGAVGGTAAANVARWDGTAWQALGEGVGGTVRALAIDDARGLYVGGEFESAGGGAAAHVALWDGGAWSALGEGTDGTVSALYRDGVDGLLVAGRFGRAGSGPSPYVARWAARPVGVEPSPSSPVAPLAVDLAPNPAYSWVTATVSYPAGPVTVAVYDALGRRVSVAVVAQGGERGAPQAVRIDLDGLAPGVYVVRATAGAQAASTRLVVAR